MSAEALYNKYRPSEFSEIYGQDVTISILQKQIENKSLPHSLVFYGPPGVGKTTTARIISKLLNPYPAGTKEIDAAVRENNVSDMRNFIPTLYLHVMEGEHLTVIFDEAHKITSDAFQALQKVVEEPPPDVTFIFVTTRVDKIPDTILDRSQRQRFSKISPDLVKKRLEEIAKVEFPGVITDQLLSDIVHVGDGSLRRSIVSLSQVANLLGSNLTDIEISEVLGIVGGPRLVDFVFRFLSKDSLSNLLEAGGGIFNADKVDFHRALYDLQQFLSDSISYMVDKNTADSLYFNVKPLFDKLSISLEESGKSIDMFKDHIISELRMAYDLSLKCESRLNSTNNGTASVRFFISGLSS